MSRFYGQIIRNKFPYKSKIRSEDSSLGGRVLDAFGDHIDDNVRSKIFQNNVGVNIIKSLSSNALHKVHAAELYSSSVFNDKIAGNAVSKVTINSEEAVRSLEEFFQSSPESFNYALSKIKLDRSPLILNLTKTSYKEKLTISLKENIRIYIDVKKINTVDEDAIASDLSIKFCGRNHLGLVIEETVAIPDEGLYSTNLQFSTLETIYEDRELGIQGGYSIQVNGLVDFEIDLLNCPVQFALNEADSREDDFSVDRKRMQLDHFLSVAKIQTVIDDNALIDNRLVVDLAKLKNADDAVQYSKIRYVHRSFLSASFYKRENTTVLDTDQIFVKVIGEVALVEDGSKITVEDFCFDEITKNIYCINSAGKIFEFESKLKDFATSKVARTLNNPIRIDCLEDRLLPGEEFFIRLLIGNIEFPLKKFLIAKITQDINNVEFLQANKSSWGEDIELFDPILNAEDLQDSLEIFHFTDTIEFDDIEFVVIEFEPNSNNLSAVNTFNLAQDKDFENFISKVKINESTSIASRIIQSSYIEPINTYTPFTNGVYSGIYINGCSRTFYAIDAQNNHQPLTPSYGDKYFYDGADLYSTEEFSSDDVVNFYVSGIQDPIEVTLS